MSAERFTLDANILIYFYDRTAGARHRLAIQIVGTAMTLECILPLQAVSEFFAAATRKRLVSYREAADAVDEYLTTFPSVSASAENVRAAVKIRSGVQASFWDAQLIATAAEAGCTAIISEDSHPGAVIHGVRIVPPFAGDALSPQVKELLGL